MEHYGPAVLFTNTGSKFTRQDITLNKVWAHDSVIADINGDTYKDVLLTDYGPNTTMLINDKVSTFKPYVDHRGTSGDLRWGGSSATVADFFQNGKTQIIVTDNACNTTNPACGPSRNKLYTWSIDASTNQLTYTYHSDLPTPRFELPKWSGHGFTGSHNVRAVAYDFNDDKIPDSIIFSMPTVKPGGNSKFSEIQFLSNNGSGKFTDVTDSTLVGYNHNTSVTYNPRFIDINGDGRTDILVSGADGNSTQFLLKSSDGKYVAAHQNILNNFSKDVLTKQGGGAANSVNVVQGPNGKLFLVTSVTFSNNGDQQLAIYASPLGSQTTLTAQTAVNLIKQNWPYMTEKQIEQTLATTSTTVQTVAGTAYVIDMDSILNPYGGLGFRNGSTIKPISGYLTGVDIGDGRAVATDQLGRSFNLDIKRMTSAGTPNAFMWNTAHIDEHTLSSHAEYLVGGPVYNINGVRVGADQRYAGSDSLSGRTGGLIPQQYTVGVPNLYQQGRFNFGMQYTNLASNPWIAMGGAWGQVNNSGILDHVFSYRRGGVSVQKGIMYTTSNITPGLVTNIRPITSVWAESGYRFTKENFGDLGFYAGVKPVILSGSVEANIPTAVDNAGNTVYSKRNLNLQNPVTGYARMLYTNMLDKKTMYRFSAMATQYGQYRIMHELKWWIN
jgi:hypothetical protein